MTRVILTFLIAASIIGSYSFSIKKQANKAEDQQEDASRVNWMTYEEAIAALEADKKAGRKGKKIFIDIYTDWCGWCKKMDKETFQKPEISAYLNKHFYPVKFNAEQREEIKFAGHTFKYVANGRRGYHELAVALLEGKMSYPTVVFLNENVEMLQRIPGYLDVPTFDMILHYLAEEHYLKTPWPTFQQEYPKRKKEAESAPKHIGGGK
jgi:thioredoxin-related protein